MNKLNFLLSSAAVLLTTSLDAFAEPCGSFPLPACAVPEPSSLPLVSLGLVAAVVVARFFNKKK
jgi:hypothetical protein